jgi:hypothetical protein
MSHRLPKRVDDVTSTTFGGLRLGESACRALRGDQLVFTLIPLLIAAVCFAVSYLIRGGAFTVAFRSKLRTCLSSYPSRHVTLDPPVSPRMTGLGPAPIGQGTWPTGIKYRTV